MSKSKDASVVKPVYEYLTKQNRPYSAIDIFNNLHKVHGKTAIIKALEVLTEQGNVRAKTYGKQIVYVADQSKLPEVSEEELKALDSRISQTQASLKDTDGKYKKLDSALRSLNTSISTEEAKERLQTAGHKCEKYSSKIHQLKTNPNAVSPDERTKIMNERTQFVKQWRKRKRISNDILSAILEGYPKTKKQLYEEIGIETDEEFNVKPPEI